MAAPHISPRDDFSSRDYWEARYQAAGRSGAGSRGRLAEFKAQYLNEFVARESVHSVVEWGCGDGGQAEMFRFPLYTGIDVSPEAIRLCRKRLGRRVGFSFVAPDVAENGLYADLSISLDVIYHLIEDEVFYKYMMNLFRSARRFVIIYSSDEEIEDKAQHVRHRRFSDWVKTNQPKFQLVATIPNPYPWDPSKPKITSPSNFHIYHRIGPLPYLYEKWRVWRSKG